MKKAKFKMTGLRYVAFIILNFAFALLAGCALFQPAPESPLKRATAEELTALLRQREAAIHSMKGLFSAKVRGGFIPIASRLEGAVYYRRPNALRLRGFTSIGSELFEFVQADDLYKLRLPTRVRKGKRLNWYKTEIGTGWMSIRRRMVQPKAQPWRAACGLNVRRSWWCRKIG
ncbi:MAG: hypothetical protein HY038_03565 [Nitrospirae bacterium]|nr:hypothetical protein [Nitrospirota bacterium]